MKPLIIILILCFPAIGNGQIDTLPDFQGQDDLIESFFQDLDQDTEFDYNDVFEDLSQLRKKPLALNRISSDDLSLFPFLTPVQMDAFIAYRNEHGPFLSIYELQAIPHFDLQTIARLLPFIEKGMNLSTPITKFWENGLDNQLILRMSRTLQEKRGFLENDEGKIPYEGSQNSYYLRYRGTMSSNLSFGFTAEKDEGESFFSKNNKQGFDFYSAHLFYSNPTGRIKNVAIGDYSVSMGQGLILFNGFTQRKGPASLGVIRTGRSLKRYTSVNESDFMRGGAMTVDLGNNLELTAFYSSKKQDANVDETDGITDDEEAFFVTSLQTSGKHRTEAEISDEGAVRQSTAGGILKWKSRKTQVSLNGLYNNLSAPLSRNAALYNQYYFSGDQLTNISIDYNHSWRNLHLFGETATSNNGAFASTNGLLASLDQKMDVAILHRYFQKDYIALNAKPFAETSGVRNETGTYLGFEMRPNSNWIVNAYFDFWKHNWLRFRTDAPSVGKEWLLRVTYLERKKMEVHFQLKNEIKAENLDAPDGRYDQLFERQNFQMRAHLTYKLNKNWEWRTRFYAGFTEINGERLDGVAMFQDLKYRSVGVPIAAVVRVAVFDTDDYAVRFYAYENDVLNSFTVPAYYGRGSRMLLMTSYRIRRGLTLEGRIARTYFSDRQIIGSGNDEINGPSKTDIKFQLRWNF